MMIRRNRTQTESRRRGAAIVETAVVLPIFFMIVLGIVEFGRAMMVAQLLTNGAREGARLAALPDATNTSVETAVLDFVESSVGVPRSKVTVTISVTPAPGNPNPANVLANARKRDLCNVKVDVGFSDVDYIPGKFLADRKLMGQCAMRRE
jgi:Flp pilus assembly protein TadG